MDPVIADIGAGGGQLPWWTQFITPELVAIVLIAVLILLLITAFIVWRIVRRIRHDPRWARRALALQAAYAPAGAKRELVGLRLQRRDAVAGVQRAVDTAAAGGTAPGDLASLTRRIQRMGAALDEQLQLLAEGPDDAALDRLLPPTRERAKQFVGIATSVRQAAIQASLGATDSEFLGLQADVDQEVELLQTYVQTLRSLTLGEPLDPSSSPSPPRK